MLAERLKLTRRIPTWTRSSYIERLSRNESALAQRELTRQRENVPRASISRAPTYIDDQYIRSGEARKRGQTLIRFSLAGWVDIKSTEAAFPPRPEVFSVSDMRDHTLRRPSGGNQDLGKRFEERCGALTVLIPSDQSTPDYPTLMSKCPR